mgnify:CR=1 FL=1|jgi:hypothetical protein
MRIKEPKVMQELHKIREKHYRQTKGMSLHEHLKWIQKKAEEFEYKEGLQGMKLSKVA